MNFKLDPSINDAECVNAAERLDDRYNQSDMANESHPEREVAVNPLGYVRWLTSYFVSRQLGHNHAASTDRMIVEIMAIEAGRNADRWLDPDKGLRTDPGVSDAECADVVNNLEIHYLLTRNAVGGFRYPRRVVRVDQLGYGRWIMAYLSARQNGLDHEFAIRSVLAAINRIVGVPSTPHPPTPIPGDFPSVPSRDQVITVLAGFCNHQVDLPKYGGSIPCFDPYIDCMDPESRAIVYDTKKELGLSHMVASLGPMYRESDYDYPVNVTYRDLREDVPTFAGIVEEIVKSGLIPIVSFTSGGQDDFHFWADNNGARLRAAKESFDHLTPFVLYAILWEVVGPGGDWTGEQIETMILLHREIFGDEAHLAIEFGQGYSHWGASTGNWNSAAGMAIDVFLFEAAQPVLDNPGNADKNLDCTSRLLGPSAKNIPEANRGPYYLSASTSRGPRRACWFESDAFVYIRGQMDDAGVNAVNKWAADHGWTDFGNGQPAKKRSAKKRN